MIISFFPLVLLIAAAWRLSSLFANEEGPYMIFHRFRKWAEKSRARWIRRSRFATLLKCEWCNSIWFGAALTVGYRFLGEIVLWIALPLVISTGVILVKLVVHVLSGLDKRLDQINNPPVENPETYSLEEAIMQSIFERKEVV